VIKQICTNRLKLPL